MCSSRFAARNNMIHVVVASVVVLQRFATVVSQTASNQSQMMNDINRACTIYCEGEVLRTIQLSGIYNDSKTFVDMPMIFDPEVVLANFNAISDRSNITALQDFMADNFYEVGSDLYSSPPTDLQSNPAFLTSITDPAYQQWASDINQLWGVLGKKVNASVAQNPQRHSFVPISYPMIVPGGRFRESYYWDSWWILKGLLVCDMAESALNVVNILLDEVANFGFVPNGARIYYLDRSQPPVLSEMVLDMCNYFGWQSANTSALLITAYPLLEAEYAWWMDPAHGHVTPPLASVTEPSNPLRYTLNMYHSNGTTPRPESYLEDSVNGNTSVFWNNVRTGAETGWDFSSRWIANPHTFVSDIVTTEIVPVDLNAILYRYELNLALLQATMLQLGLESPSISAPLHSAEYYAEAAQNRSVAIEQVLWNNATSCWMDFNLTAGTPNDNGITTASSYTPLWAGLAPDHPRRIAVYESFLASGLHQPGGILTTTDTTGQQWDAPNAWPPLVWLTIEGLLRLDLPQSVDLAQNISAEWLWTGYLAYNASGYMYEKYNAYEVGVGGGGGEYVPQVGFGWTNGVALYLLNKSLPSGLPGLFDDDFNTVAGNTNFDLVAVWVTVAVLFCLLCCTFGSYFWYSKIVATGDLSSATTLSSDNNQDKGGECKGEHENLSIEFNPLVGGASRVRVAMEDIELANKH